MALMLLIKGRPMSVVVWCVVGAVVRERVRVSVMVMVMVMVKVCVCACGGVWVWGVGFKHAPAHGLHT